MNRSLGCRAGWFGMMVVVGWMGCSVAAWADPAPSPRTTLALEQANAFLDRTERELDARQLADAPAALATDARSALLRQLRFVGRELAELDSDAAAVIARLDALTVRVSGPSVKMIGTGVIEGRVTARSTGLPIGNASLELWRANGNFIDFVGTDADGTYRFTALPVAGYRLRVYASDGFVDEVYRDISCADGCSISQGDVVSLLEGQVVGGVDFELATAGSIRGTVREAATGIPIPFLHLNRFGDGPGFPSTMTDIDGDYTFSGLGAGPQKIWTDSGRRFLDEIFDDIPCFQLTGFGCDPHVDGTPVSVMVDQQVEGIDFGLERGAVVSGRIRGADTGVGVRDWTVLLYDRNGQEVHGGQTDDDGDYEIRGLPAGTYFAVAVLGYGPTPFVNVLYDGQPCPVPPNWGGCDPAAGTPIELDHNGARTIDFALPRRGAVSGTVMDASSGQPIAGVVIELHDEFGFEIRRETTNLHGAYRFENVKPASHRSKADASGTDYLDEVFEDVACDPYCDMGQGTPIAVAVDLETVDINFSLDQGGAIEGRIFDAVTGLPLGSEFIRLLDSNLNSRSELANDQGEFRFRRLRGDSYRVVVNVFDYLPEAWDNVYCVGTSCSDKGDEVLVAPGQTVTGIDMALDRGGAVRGIVLDATNGGGPILFPSVALWDVSGTIFRLSSSGKGGYAFEDLPPGQYRVATNSYGRYMDQAWPDVSCPASGCDGTQGELIEIELGTMIDGINFSLDPIGCQATTTAMCLNQERFRVQVDWRTPQGNTGSARPGFLTDDSGYLWFFDQDNVEAVIKVLDACSAPANRFWVFAAGLTNVEAVVRVTDTWTNTERVYTNPLGTPFAPIQDTQAFDTCEAQPPNGFAVPVTSSVETTTAEPPILKGGCPYDLDTLCLANGRFVVRAHWTNPSGASGMGQASQLTSDTGYFWFFNPDNVEVIVKVLDACTSPSQRFWVFAGGLTNVKVELEVLDTVTDEIKIYTNPLGTSFAPIQDTQAFDTCP